MNHEEFREYFDENEEELLSKAGGFYSDVRSGIKEELEEFESNIDASIGPPSVCMFAPIEMVNDELAEEDYRIESVTEEQFLTAMSMYMGYKHKEAMPDELAEMCFYFINHEDHWVQKILEYITDRSYQKYAGRFFPEYNSLAVNVFTSADLFAGDIPEFLVPVRRFMLISGEDARSTIIHEMTHAYIRNKSSFRSYNRDIYSIDEAAAQSVTNVLNGGNVPSAEYYRDRSVKQEIMQAARQVFLEAVENREEGPAVSIIRVKAVEAIDKITDGEDPIRALREEDDYRSKLVRIVSYATKKMARDVKRDLAVVGLSQNKAFQEYMEEEGKIDVLKDINTIRGDLERIDYIGKVLVSKSHTNSVSKNLRRQTEKVGEDARKISEIVGKDFEDSLPDDSDIEVLDDVFGDPDWTDPDVRADDVELEEYFDGVLYRYSNVVEEGLRRARRIEKATKTIHSGGESLAQKTSDKETRELLGELIDETERLHKEIDEVRRSLIESVEMAETAESKIEKLKE